MDAVALKAHREVRKAIRRGQLERPAKCSVCRVFRPLAHHDDYSKPLDVIWLCHGCHVRRHEQLGWGCPGRRVELGRVHGPLTREASELRDLLLSWRQAKPGRRLGQLRRRLGVRAVRFSLWSTGRAAPSAYERARLIALLEKEAA